MKHEVPSGRIPGLELPVSRIFFGTAMPPVMTDEEAALPLLDSVFEAGVNAFDCARSYGRAENALGRWLRSRGIRKQAVLLTKCGDIRDGRVEVNRQVIRTQLEEQEIRLTWDDEVIRKLAEDGYDPKFGARPLRRMIQRTVEDTLSEELLQGRIQLGREVRLTVQEDKIALSIPEEQPALPEGKPEREPEAAAPAEETAGERG